jgi:hypothetical protein
MPKARAAAPTPPSVKPKARKFTTHATAQKVTRARSVPDTVTFDPADQHAAIALLAYRNWQARGDGPGSPEEDWLRAETEFRAAQRA